MTSPIDPVEKLADLARQAAKRVGLDQVNFAVVVDPDGKDTRLQALYGVPPDLPAAPLSDDEQAMFAAMEEQLREQTKADQMDKTKEGLKSLLRDPKRGFFEEDEDE